MVVSGTGQSPFLFLDGLLLFLLGGQKKKITKRKTAGFRFEAAAKRIPTETQELASLRQPAFLFVGIRFSAFSPQN
ncbi:hypothetical protein [Phocaeicola barnesiae]|uniref:Uncharacterized protein n=1 Tax=Phocaeicola barnesiae TaxID=376804 RepID=A0AAW5N327_9BACT|nr:hypothetical protein [Phocaeicola barnesiae]MCR8873070.1 hypothetical protein [Phocaeicola barnesiae]MDM8308048.1 hypothetical protein [Phocaeicola barnesiae]